MIRSLALAALIAGAVTASARANHRRPRSPRAAAQTPRGDRPARRRPSPDVGSRRRRRRRGAKASRSTSRSSSRSPISAAAAPAVKRTVTMIVADLHTRIDPFAIGRASQRAGDVPAEHRRDASTADRRQDPRWASTCSTTGRAPFESAASEPQPGASARHGHQDALHDSVTLILESGKPMIAAQSADPIGDRR